MAILIEEIIMKFKLLILCASLALTGCQSYKDYVKARHAERAEYGELQVLPGGQIAYFNKPQVPNHKFEKPVGYDAFNEMISGSAEKEERDLRELKEQAQKQKLTCSQRAVITYRIMQEQAYATGDYTQVMNTSVQSLKKICEKQK